MSVLIETSLGDLVIDLHVKRCPQTTLNFLKLCKIKYYNFCCFHNVQKDFMVQTGDPTATGKGGESLFGILYGPQRRYFPAEIHPKLKHKNKGTVSMAVASDGKEGGDVSGSQFFITTGENLDYLDGKHTVFGEVAEGFDVLEEINNVYCDDTGRPYKDIRIKHTIVLEDPFEDPEGLQVPDQSPLPTQEMLETIRIAEDESIEPELPPDEMEKLLRRKEAAAQALTLEMIGDIPFAEVKPPENVLFVCQLNPVTQDEDLELIFSRFGQIDNCEIIRDKKTGDSLCYAFIEFENREDCETAYFKMNNVLIDDRRIKVDFSQSVSKIHNDWLKTKMTKRGSIGYGGSENLERRTQYRGGNDAPPRSKYEMVFEERERPHSDTRKTSQDRDSHQDDYGYRERDRDDRRERDRNSRYRNDRHDRDKDYMESKQDRDFRDKDSGRTRRPDERSDRRPLPRRDSRSASPRRISDERVSLDRRNRDRARDNGRHPSRSSSRDYKRDRRRVV
ncbi:hypothetical protein G9A89_002276 [Geosiphon pyriformis]|nr:hypothetical protein G9A89_002276 [Geosiphon pyriformis]